MKKTIYIGLMTMVMALALTGCGADTDEVSDTVDKTSDEVMDEKSTTEEEPMKDEAAVKVSLSIGE